MQDFDGAASPKRHLSEFTPQDIEDSIKGEGPNVNSNHLWSEGLTRAHRNIKATGSTDAIEAFEDVVRTVLSGEYAKDGGSGFDTRASIGQAVEIMFGQLSGYGEAGNTYMFDKLLTGPYDTKGDPVLTAQLKTLKAELKPIVVEQGHTVHTTYKAYVRAAAPKLSTDV